MKITVYKNRRAELQMIETIDKVKEPRRIVTYDLESYKEPIERTNGRKETQTNYLQHAYAIGWSFIIEDHEEKWCEANGYTLHEVKINDQERIAAYKQYLGEGCLNKAIHEWMSQPIFHDTVLYAHNGGKFDIRLILDQSDLLMRKEYKIDNDSLIELNSCIINMDVLHQDIKYPKTTTNKNGVEKTTEINHKISLRDSLPLFGPGSKLSKLCKEMNVTHGKLEEQVWIHDLMFKDTWEKLWQEHDMNKYLLHDVLGLLEVLEKFAKNIQDATTHVKDGKTIAGLHISNINTGASLAKKYFLKMYYNTSYEHHAIYTLPKHMDQFVRKSYSGGRCENFIQGEVIDKIYYYDFTSLYPYAATFDLPVGKPKFMVDLEQVKNPVDQKRIITNFWRRRFYEDKKGNKTVFWQVKVRSPLAAQGKMMDPMKRKPLFGIKEEGRYLFRWFKDWTELTLHEDEILKAMELGLDYEFEPINGMLFNKTTILKECMSDLFKNKAEAKKNGQPVLSKAWKIIINSLYGVWGLRVSDRDGIEIAKHEDSNWALDLALGKLCDIEERGEYLISRRAKDLEVKEFNVALASAITSKARLILYELMCDIQDRNGMLIYCDTDSLVTNYSIEDNQVMKDKWIGPTNGEALGSLKNEIDECYEKLKLTPKKYFDRAVVVAPKMYCFSAENGQIIKKAHKGYKEDTAKGDIVTYERMQKLVDLSLEEHERVMTQTTIQWKGGNAAFFKKGNHIGVELGAVNKTIKATTNKGLLNGIHMIPFDTKPAGRVEEEIEMKEEELVIGRRCLRRYPITKFNSVRDVDWWENAYKIETLQEPMIKWVTTYANGNTNHQFGLGDRKIAMDILEEKKRNMTEPCYLYEVLNEDCRLYADIDCDDWQGSSMKPNQVLLKTIQLICIVAQEDYNVEIDPNRFKVCSATTDKKISFHITHPDHVFPSTEHQKTFWHRVQEQSMRVPDLINPKKNKSIVDDVYGKNRPMRTVLSEKPGKQILEPIWIDEDGEILKLNLDELDLSDYLINLMGEENIPEYSGLSTGLNKVKKYQGVKTASKNNILNRMSIMKDVVNEIEAHPMLVDFKINKQIGDNLIELVRIRPGACPICKDGNGNPDYHEKRDGFVTLRNGSINNFGCYKNKDMKLKLSEKDCMEEYFESMYAKKVQK